LITKPTPRNVNLDNDRFAMFNKERNITALQAVALPLGRGE
jgi:hypothetical protein